MVYPSEWSKGEEPYYPINDVKNSALYAEYAKLAESQKVIICMQQMDLGNLRMVQLVAPYFKDFNLECDIEPA